MPDRQSKKNDWGVTFNSAGKVDLSDWHFPQLDQSDGVSKRERTSILREISKVLDDEIRRDTSMFFDFSNGAVFIGAGIPLAAHSVFCRLRVTDEVMRSALSDHFPDAEELRKIEKRLRGFADIAARMAKEAEIVTSASRADDNDVSA